MLTTVSNVLHFQSTNYSVSPCTPQNITNKNQLSSVNSFQSSNTNWIPVQLMKTWYRKRHPNPVRIFLSKYSSVFQMPKAWTNATKTELYKIYIFSNHLFKKSSNVATPVLPKARECPTLIAAAYVGLGASRDQKEGLYTPNFMGILWDLFNQKSIILRSTQYKVMVILVQGWFKAVSGRFNQ